MDERYNVDDNWLDLVFVDYYGGGIELCYTTITSVEAGEKVTTDFGDGIAIDVKTVFINDSLFQFIAKHRDLQPIRGVYRKIEYKEDKHDLSEE